jgi:glycerol-3-phosphate O-acyltransferase
MLVREQHPFGDVLCLDAVGAVLMTWYRNNVIHTLALPSLIACLLINRRRPVARAALVGMVETVYPYLAAELFVASDGTLAERVDCWLTRLIAQGLLRTNAQGQLSAPSPETNVKYRLEFLASVVMQILERFFIAIALLEKIGQGRMDRPTLEQNCQDVARRMSRLHGLNAPEFFDPRLFHGFLDTLIDRGAVTVDDAGLLAYQSVVSEVIRAAGAVLPTAFRDAVLRAGVRIAGDDGVSGPVTEAE